MSICLITIKLKKWVKDNFDNENDFYSTHLIFEVGSIKKYWDIKYIKLNSYI
jgi:hypothetical protein